MPHNWNNYERDELRFRNRASSVNWKMLPVQLYSHYRIGKWALNGGLTNTLHSITKRMYRPRKGLRGTHNTTRATYPYNKPNYLRGPPLSPLNYTKDSFMAQAQTPVPKTNQKRAISNQSHLKRRLAGRKHKQQYLYLKRHPYV